MSAITTRQMADRVAALIEQRLRVGGDGLTAKLRRAGRRLPKPVRLAGQVLAQAADLPQSPRLAQQIDDAAVAAAYDICLRHLGPAARARGPWGALAGLAGAVVFSALAALLLALALAWWRGLI